MARSLFALPVLLALAIGCGGGGSSPSNAANPESLTLPAAGGAVSARGGAVELVLPVGAVAADKPITIRDYTGGPEKDRIVPGTAFRFTSTTFATPIRLRIAYNQGALPATVSEEDLAIYKLVKGKWSPAGSTVDPSANAATATVRGFSDYAILMPDRGSVVAEATLEADGVTPAVRVSWSRGAFERGDGAARWQVYRNDVAPAPTLVVSGEDDSTLDSSARSATEYTDYADFGKVGGSLCEHQTPANAALPPSSRIVPGRPYLYQAQLVYRILGIDMGDGTTSGGGTTAATSGGESGIFCYFLSGKATSGAATPIAPPTVVSPRGGIVPDVADFSFSSVVPPGAAFQAEYVVELSTEPTFPRDPAKTHRIPTFASSDGGTVSHRIDLGSLPAPLREAQGLYYRVGARNAADRPGPVPDALSGQRFVYGERLFILRPVVPPAP